MELREKIIELAISVGEDPSKFIDFPSKEEVFVLLSTPIGVKDSPIVFNGYYRCDGYEIDYDYKPAGKWITMYQTNLSIYPPVKNHLRLQPHHIVLGRFQNQDRTVQFSILKIDYIGNNLEDALLEKKQEPKIMPPEIGATNILQFPKK